MILNYLQVILLGILGSISLIIGAFFGYRFNISKKVIAITLAFTTGILTSAVCFDLLVEAYYYGGFEPMITGFFVGVTIFTLVDLILNHFSIKEHKNLKASKNSDNLDSVYLDSDNDESINNSSFNKLKSGLLNVYSHKYKKSFNKYQIESIITIIGALLDGIPESIAIGLILIIGGPISVSLLIAVFIANLFEGISSSRNMKLGGWSGKSIFKVWTFVLILSAFSTLLSYTMFSHTDHHILSGALGVAAGALISIVADVLLPDAYSETHEFTGFLMALGLLVSFILSHLNN
ncbi:MAG: hypothetical protein LBD03_06170 [Methanobrevibacter sp.]|jgi:ZIP family zinc transporter|nr:hypothetical protein [Candidatus Methanovirga procula]